MEEKISKNLQLNFLITICIGILGFLNNKYFLKYMGIDLLGLMNLFTQMIAYLNLVDLGLSGASSYSLYKPLAEKNIEQINIIISTIDSFYKKISLLILLIGIFLLFFIPEFIKVSFISSEKIFIYWILYVLNTSISYLFAKYTVLFTANQEYGYVRKIQGIGKILFQCIQILTLIYFSSFIIYISLLILENLFSYYFYKKHYIKHYFYIKKVKNISKEIVTNMKQLFWHKIAGLVVSNTDYIVLSKFVSLSIIGIYSSYLMVYKMVTLPLNILNPVLTPKIGKLIAIDSKKNIYIYWKELYYLYNFVATILITITYISIGPFVQLWLGDEFILNRITIILILINLYIDLIRGVTDIFKLGFGFFKDWYLPFLEALINLIVSLILVRKLGLNGVILGTVISNILIIYILKPIIVFKKCLKEEIKKYFKISLKLLLFSIGSLVSILFLLKLNKNFLEITTWFEFIYRTIIVSFVTILVTFLYFIICKDFRILLKKILKIIKEKIQKKY